MDKGSTSLCLSVFINHIPVCSPSGQPLDNIFFHFIYLFFLFFWPCPTACGIFVPRPGIKPTPLHWKRTVLTTGPPGKSVITFKTLTHNMSLFYPLPSVASRSLRKRNNLSAEPGVTLPHALFPASGRLILGFPNPPASVRPPSLCTCRSLHLAPSPTRHHPVCRKQSPTHDRLTVLDTAAWPAGT